jgi:hypothetical protein
MYLKFILTISFDLCQGVLSGLIPSGVDINISHLACYMSPLSQSLFFSEGEIWRFRLK